MKTAFAILAAAAGACALSGAAGAQCYAMYEDAEPTPMDGYTVVEASAEPGLMDRPPAPDDAVGVLCERESVAPDANDFEILYHMPLYIRTEGENGDTTVLALGVREGNYVVQLPQGDITEDERAAIVAALEGFNEGEAALQEYMEAQQGEDG